MRIRTVLEQWLAGLVAALALSAAPVDHDGVRLTVDVALERAFPKAKVERARHVLDEAQVASVAKASGDGEFKSKVAFRYVARDDKGALLGYAFFDAHVVRSKRETLMVVVTPEGKVREVVVLAFQEPAEYIPSARWYQQFAGRALDDDLRLGGKIDACTGATLTSRATTLAARRSLALQAALTPPPPPPRPSPAPQPTPESGQQP